LKPIRFVPICSLLATALACGQANDAPLRSQPIVQRTGRPSEFVSAPMPQGPRGIPTRAPSRKSQTPQSAEFSFASAVTYDSGGFNADAIVAADVNGDGKPDLVVVNACGSDSTCSTNGSVGVLLNNGNGTFSTAVTYSSNGLATDAVAVADVNGDGKPDIVVVNPCPPANPVNAPCTTDGTIAVLVGNGDGTFQAAVNYDSGGINAVSVSIADVNADGHPDLVVVNKCGSDNTCTSDGTVAVLLGKGDGTFQAAVTHDTGGFGADAVAVADLRGGGKLDLVVANSCGTGGCPYGIPPQNGSIGVLLGNGDGTFQAATTYLTSSALTEAVAVADLSGNGTLDIVASNNCGITTQQECKGAEGSGVEHVDVFVGKGDGTFQDPVPYDTSAMDMGSVAIADVNGDGIPDLEVVVLCAPDSETCSFDSSAGVLLGNGDGTFQAPQYFGPIGTPAAVGALAALAVADVDGDGKPDLVLANFCNVNTCATTAEHSLLGVMINTSTFPNSAPSTTTVTSSPNPSNVGQSVTFTVTVSASGSGGTPTGTISLFDGSTGLGLFPLNSSGIATVPVTTLAAGANSITATYNGDAGLTRSSSPAVSQVVQGLSPGQDFSLTPSSSTASVMRGQAATYTVVVSPLGGFNQTVSLSCSGAPTQSTCSLSPNSVTLNGSAPASVTVTVTTVGNSALLAPPGAFPNIRGALLLCTALFGLPGLLVLRSSTARVSKRRSRFVSLTGVCVVLLGLLPLGCGGNGGHGGGTPPATYNLSLTGTFTSGSTTLTHNAKLTLVVE
jgi:Bacterial Ig-like domain (group 3)/FG-GAP-like repeat